MISIFSFSDELVKIASSIEKKASFIPMMALIGATTGASYGVRNLIQKTLMENNKKIKMITDPNKKDTKTPTSKI